MHLLIGDGLSEPRSDAGLLCVGVGTCPGLIYLAERFPGCRFVAVEPSAPMLDARRQKAEEPGIAARCEFHEGYLESLAPRGDFDPATSLLASQSILDRETRSGFLREMAERLRPGGHPGIADPSSDASLEAHENCRQAWFRLMRAGGFTPEAIEKMRAAHDRDVPLLPPNEVGGIILTGGFEAPVYFLWTGLSRARYARRA